MFVDARMLQLATIWAQALSHEASAELEALLEALEQGSVVAAERCAEILEALDRFGFTHAAMQLTSRIGGTSAHAEAVAIRLVSRGSPDLDILAVGLMVAADVAAMKAEDDEEGLLPCPTPLPPPDQLPPPPTAALGRGRGLLKGPVRL